MHWRQVALAVCAAVFLSFYLNRYGYSPTQSIAAGVLVYFAVRWFIAWMFRVQYWYRRGTRGIYTQSCANCGRYIHRKGDDWIITCHRCGWKAGLPITRWFTKSVPSIQLRRTVDGPQLVVVFIAAAVVVAGVPASLQDGGGSIDSSPSRINNGGSQSGVQDSTDQRGTSTQTENKRFNRTALERHIWNFTNEKRIQNGLGRVEYAPRIVDPARNHAQNMAKHDYVGHTQPNGQTGEERYSDVCNYRGSGYSFGENAIAGWYGERFEAWKTGEVVDTEDEKELAKYLVEGWMNSQGHRENILNPSWGELGVGVYKRDDGKVFAAQTFC
jgi:uncharacterized protein YkwD